MTAPPAEFYRPESLCPEDSVGYLMRRIGASLTLQVDRQLAAHDLTHAQWLPIYKLSKSPGQTLADMARELMIDPGTLTRAVDKLEHKGLVRRLRSTADRRIVQLELTPEGQRMAAVVPPVLSRVLNAHLAGFSHDDWRQLVQLLQRMHANGEALRALEEVQA